MEVCSPNSVPKQSQLWGQSRMLRALSTWAWTLLRTDCTSSLLNVSHCLTLHIIFVPHNIMLCFSPQIFLKNHFWCLLLTGVCSLAVLILYMLLSPLHFWMDTGKIYQLEIHWTWICWSGQANFEMRFFFFHLPCASADGSAADLASSPKTQNLTT